MQYFSIYLNCLGCYKLFYRIWKWNKQENKLRIWCLSGINYFELYFLFIFYGIIFFRDLNNDINSSCIFLKKIVYFYIIKNSLKFKMIAD